MKKPKPVSQEEIMLINRELELRGGLLFWKAWSRNRKMDCPAGAKEPRGYVVVGLRRRKYYAHRIVWLLTYGEWPEFDIDHIDGDKSNNLPSNLRLATRSQNNLNSKMRSGKTSVFRGVSWSKRAKKWYAQFKPSNYHQCFDSEIDAALAYDAAAIAHSPDFARTNQRLGLMNGLTGERQPWRRQA